MWGDGSCQRARCVRSLIMYALSWTEEGLFWHPRAEGDKHCLRRWADGGGPFSQRRTSQVRQLNAEGEKEGVHYMREHGPAPTISSVSPSRALHPSRQVPGIPRTQPNIKRRVFLARGHGALGGKWMSYFGRYMMISSR